MAARAAPDALVCVDDAGKIVHETWAAADSVSGLQGLNHSAGPADDLHGKNRGQGRLHEQETVSRGADA